MFFIPPTVYIATPDLATIALPGSITSSGGSIPRFAMLLLTASHIVFAYKFISTIGSSWLYETANPPPTLNISNLLFFG